MAKYAGPLAKETFKTALTACEKEAWIWHSFDNFKQMLHWQNEQKWLYGPKVGIESEDEYNEDGSAIDLVAIYDNLLTDSADGQDVQSLWEDEEGFSFTKFQGEQIENGNEVGDKARLFWTLDNAKKSPDKKVKDFSSILNFADVQKATQELLASQQDEYHYLFEPAFGYDENHLRTRCDILRLKDDNHVEIIEMKATSKIKPEHFFDLAYQVFVLEKNGLIVDQIYLGHLQDKFILGVPFEDSDLPLKDLAADQFASTSLISYEEAKKAWEDFKKKPWNPDTSLQMVEDQFDDFFEFDPWLKKEAKRTKPYLLMDAYRELEAEGRWEEWFEAIAKYVNQSPAQIERLLNKNNCEFPATPKSKKELYYWSNPEPFCYHVMPWFDQSKPNIFQLTGNSVLSRAKKAQIYRETGQVYFENIKTLSALESQLSTFNEGKSIFQPFHHDQLQLAKRYLNHNFTELDCLRGKQGPIHQKLNDYKKYPVLMYDFETVKWAIPRFNRSKGYQQIPFQYSIDVLTNNHYDYNQPSTMAHYDFLANEKNDPRPAFIYHFLDDIFSEPAGVYVAYNDSFEKSVLKYLAWAFPELSTPIYYIVQNTIDLMDFFKGKKDSHPWFMINHPLFEGSYSIKKTQPALEPNFSYRDLTINKGDKASQVFREFVDGLIPQEVWDKKIYPDMLAYCNRDTLAMVVILQRVRDLYQKWEQQNELKK